MDAGPTPPSAEFVDVGPPLSPAEAGMLEFELEKRGVVTRLRFCERAEEGDRQAVQVATPDLAAALVVRGEVLPPEAAPEAPPASRSHRFRNAAIAGLLGLVAAGRVARIVAIPKGGSTALVMLGVAAAVAAAAFGLTRE
ncbi:MAG: hypothetical protein L6Q95_06370 [Planctomycetes bacterium]|nr:hypothetical protein [Planctomycetota bacterium]